MDFHGIFMKARRYSSQGRIDLEQGAFREYLSRSVVKAISYRIIVVIADFIAVYFFTGRLEIALGFVVVSNIYTSALYFLHERFWDRVAWGRTAG
jgi:uncharacterized membrane protein